VTANPHRGEVAVRIGARDLVLRPTFEAMAEIEATLGQGLVPLTRRVVQRDFGARDVAAVLLAGANAALRPGERLKPEDVQKAVADAGVLGFVGPIVAFLANCLTGGAERKDGEPGEAAAAEAR
jgi:hypothetical protein